MLEFVAVCNLNANSRCEKRPSAPSASDPPKKNGEMGRILLAEYETLLLPQLREGGGKTPSQGDVLEELEVNPTEKSGIFARVVCTGVADIELTDCAVQVLGMGKDRREFMVHLCSPQRLGRCEESGAALHIGNWTVVPEEADRGVERKEMTETCQGPEFPEAEPALFGSIVGEGLAAQVATLAGELGLDPPSRPMGGMSSITPRSPRLGSKNGGRALADEMPNQVEERWES